MDVYSYGAEPQHTVTDKSGNVQDGIPMTVWTAQNGTQITALFDMNGNMLPGYVITDKDGRYRFKIMSDQYPEVWLRDPEGDWYLCIADQVLGEIPDAIETANQAAADVELLKKKIPDYWVPVETFGKVGTTDDTNTFQAGLDHLADLGGGTLLLPPGTYRVAGASALRIHSNTRIFGNGTILTKAASSFYSMFTILSDDQQGYGSGAENVIVDGITFRGRFGSDPMQICPFAFHHAERVLVQNCVFDRLQRNGHTFDMGGCRDIVIRNCTWFGFDISEGSGTSEAIQIDVSAAGAVSYQDGAASYDGLMTCRVWVDQCRFLPVDDGGTTYPCPNPIGGHASIEGHTYDDIWVTDNLIIDPAPQIGDGRQYGTIHVPNARRLKITGNTFRQTHARSCRAIGSVGTTDGTLLDAVNWSISGNATGAFADPLYCQDVLIAGNSFEGFGDTASPYPVIDVEGPTNEVFSTGIVITDNIFIDCNDGLTGDGAGISLKNCGQVRCGGNTFLRTQTAYRFNWVKGVTIGAGDTIEKASYRAVYAPVVSDLTIAGLTVITPGSIYIGSSSTTNLCEDIAITGCSLGSAVTLASSVRGFLVVGNIFRGSGAAAVVLGSGTDKGRVGMNSIIGFTAPTSGTPGTDVIVDDVVWAA